MSRSADRLGLRERLEQARGEPGMLFVQLFPDHQSVHDGEDGGAPEIVALDLAVVRKQPDDIRALAERGRMARAEHGIDFPRRQKVAHGNVVRDHLDVDALRNLDLFAAAAEGRIAAAVQPPHRTQVEAVVFLQHAADPDCGGLLVAHHADAAAGEVGGLLDAGLLLMKT